MIAIEQLGAEPEELEIGLLHVRHEYHNVNLQVDLTRPADSDLTEEEQESLVEQPISGRITLTNPSDSGVALSNIQIQIDIDELERSMDYDVALVDPDTGQLKVDPDHLDPGEDAICEYSWIITNKFGEIGADFRVVFSIRPSYQVTTVSVTGERNRAQDIGEATVSVSS